MGRIDARAIVVDQNREPAIVLTRQNRNRIAGVAERVVKQVSDHFLQILLLTGEGQVGRNGERRGQVALGVDPLHDPQHTGEDGCHPGVLTRLPVRGGRAGPRQMPVDVAVGRLHLFRHGLRQRSGGRCRSRVAEHRQGRLEGVREVASLGSGAGEHGVVAVEHAIEILHQGLQLGRKATVEPVAAAIAQRLQRPVQGFQWRQPHRHLRPRGQCKQQAQRGERGRQHAVEALGCGHGFAQVCRDHQAPPDLRLIGQHQRALHHAQRLALRTGAVVPVQRAVCQGVGGQEQLGVPQRTRPQQTGCAAAVGAQAVDLPVQA